MQDSVKPEPTPLSRLREAIHKARIEEAERTDVILHLHAAEVARLDLLRDRLGPIFAEIPEHAPQFDLALQHGDPPRLWIDMVAFVLLGHDRQTYRFVQDTHLGRKSLFESADVEDMAERVTAYVAQRLVEREKLLVADAASASVGAARSAARPPRAADVSGQEPVGRMAPRRRRRAGAILAAFILGVLAGALGLLLAALWITAGP